MTKTYPKNEIPKISNKQFLKTVFWIFKIYFKISPWKTILMIVTDLFNNIKPLVYGWILAKIIDTLVIIAQSTNKDLMQLAPMLITMLIYFLISESLIRSLNRYASRGLSLVSRNELEKLLYQQLNSLGIQNLENPDVVNRIQRCQQWIYNTYDLLRESINLIANFGRAIASCIAVISVFPLIIPILVLLNLLRYYPDNYFMKLDSRWQVDNTEGKRKAGTSAGMLESSNNLQEISILGAFKYLNQIYVDFYTWYNQGLLKIIRDREVSNCLLNSLDSFIGVVAYGLVFRNFLLNEITLGTVTFQMRAIDNFGGAIESMLGSITYMNEFATQMYDLVVLFEMKPAIPDGTIELPTLQVPPEIEFKHVAFKYPNADKFVFNDLNLKIDKGEKVALVGHNGAGKTTIVKLLSRIYPVTKGEILVNGINLNDLAINDWYKNIGVLFQDFNFYSHLTARENIYLGRSVKKMDKDKIIQSAKNADAHNFIREYKNGYDQIMSERFKGGIRPSSGQQQKIAIARFFYRDAPLAVFDEPTAAIDAVSEYKIFNKIYKFFDKKTVIIISHRFSTVRNADRILVLENGKIIEEGTHKELHKKEGRYASAYKLQAEGYKN